MRCVRSLAFLLLLALLSIPLAAQRPRPRSTLVEVDDARRGGFWVALDLGAGAESVNLKGDNLGYSDALTRPVGSIRLGGTVSQHLRLGGELFAWVNDRNGAVETLSSAAAIAQLYPFARAGLYIKGGIGLGRSAVEVDGFTNDDYGVSGHLGLGYEIRVGRRISIVPAADLVQQVYGGRGGLPGYTERLGVLSLGVAYQAGR